MRLHIPRDTFDNPTPPNVYLCNTSNKVIGQLHVHDFNGTFTWNSYSQINFTINKYYTDLLTGDYVLDSLFDKVENPRTIIVEGYGVFTVQDVQIDISDKDTKSVSAFSLEYILSQRFLESFRINTGDVDSKEVLYNEKIWGVDYKLDQLYKKATGTPFDPYEQYYIKDYSNATNYTWTQVAVDNAAVYTTYDGSTIAKTLWIKNYKNVQLYNPNNKELSLLHLVLANVPGWTVAHVDASLQKMERSFSVDRASVYDFLTNNVCDAFNCTIEYDTFAKALYVYEEPEAALLNNTNKSVFDTNIFVNRDNLANEVQLSYSAENIKTRLKVSGADDLTIREVNLGSNMLMNLDYYRTPDWMEPDLLAAYDAYEAAQNTYGPLYDTAMQKWVAANNYCNDMKYAVPADDDALLVGDTFTRLYCTYGRYKHANEYTTAPTPTYYVMDATGNFVVASPQPTAADFYLRSYYIALDAADCMTSLLDKLSLYHVNYDTTESDPDNVLLRVRNTNDDTAEVRLVNLGTENVPVYKIRVIKTIANVGIPEVAQYYELDDWIEGRLHTNGLLAALKDFKVIYIGTMGAYFVLARDESKPENLESYGTELLNNKYSTYMAVFQAQTGMMYSQEKNACIVQRTQPIGDFAEGTRWLDSDSVPLTLYRLTNGVWEPETVSVPKEDEVDYENFQRYADNYEKLQAVIAVRERKLKDLQYSSTGFAVDTVKVTPDDAQHLMTVALQKHFGDDPANPQYTYNIVKSDPNIPIYTFETSKDPISYELAESFIETKQYYWKTSIYGVETYFEISIRTLEDYKENYPIYTRKGHLYSVYLDGTTPYVVYDNATALYSAQQNYYRDAAQMANYFTADQLIRLEPFIKDDEYSNTNILLTSYESEEERLSIYRDLYKDAVKKLNVISQPSVGFSMTLGNLLALPEFEPLYSQFKLGNFINIEIEEGVVKRSRLLTVEINFDDISNLSCTFGDLITAKSEIDIHSELLKQAVQAGHTVNLEASSWSRGAKAAEDVEDKIANGLANANLQIKNADGQVIEIGENGLVGKRVLDDGSTDPEQVALINNKLCFTSDNWATAKSAFGKFTVKNKDGVPEDRWGVLADAIVAGYIEAPTIVGGSMRIGGVKPTDSTFVVNEDGSVQILTPDGKSRFATADIQSAFEFSTQLTWSGETVFSETTQLCTITCHVYHLQDEITDAVVAQTGSVFTFKGLAGAAPFDRPAKNQIVISALNVAQYASITCEVAFDDSQWITQ